MATRLIACPSCGTRLNLPVELADCVVRCGKCQARFRLPPRSTVSDDAVASWLDSPAGEDDSEASPPSHPAAQATQAAHQGGTAVHQMDPPHSGSTQELLAIGDHAVRMAQVDKHGVTFEFQAQRLQDAAFRAALPRRCLQCSARKHLRGHVVIFSPQLLDCVSLECEHELKPIALGGEDIRALSAEDLLARFPKVPNVPAPANLPMPFWICDMCTGVGAISGQIKAGSSAGLGVCRLLFHSPRRAADFLAGLGMEGTPEHQELMRRLAAVGEDPWESLSGAVQHRLKNWFKPASGEAFVAYLPDRDLGRTEDGMAGIVVSNRRLVYHTRVRHLEANAGDSLSFRFLQDGIRGCLQIIAPTWEIRRMTVDRDAVENLRRSMARASFHAVWQ